MDRQETGVEEGLGVMGSQEAGAAIKSWKLVKQSENMKWKELLDEALEGVSSPRSALRIIDEAFEYELCCNSEGAVNEYDDRVGLRL